MTAVLDTAGTVSAVVVEVAQHRLLAVRVVVRLGSMVAVAPGPPSVVAAVVQLMPTMALTVRLALAVQALRHLQTSELVVAVAVLVRQAAQAVLAEAAM
jgi:hypothetical protein